MLCQSPCKLDLTKRGAIIQYTCCTNWHELSLSLYPHASTPTHPCIIMNALVRIYTHLLPGNARALPLWRVPWIACNSRSNYPGELLEISGLYWYIHWSRDNCCLIYLPFHLFIKMHKYAAQIYSSRYSIINRDRPMASFQIWSKASIYT